MKLVGLGLAMIVMAGGMMGGILNAQLPPADTRRAAATDRAPATAPKPVVLAGLPIITADNNDATKRAALKLSTVFEPGGIEDQSVRNVTDFLRDTLKINLVINWGDLKSVGVTQETQVTLTFFSGISGDGFLQALLEAAAPGKLDYDINEGVVEVATRAWFEKQTVLRTYAGAPLLAKPFHSADQTPPEAAAVPDTQPESAGARLAELFREMVSPETWKVKGNALKYVRGDLMVGAGPRAQWEVSALYDDMLRPIRVPVEKTEKMELPPRLKELDVYKHASERLDADVAELSAEQQPLRKVLAYLRDSQNVNIFVDWRALAEAKVTPETPISLNLRHVPFRKVLAETLAAASPAGDLIWDMSPEGYLAITTKAARPERTVVAVFEIRDLIRRQIFYAPGPKKPGTVELAQKIMATLQAAGERDDWWKEALVHEWDGLVLVRATPEVQRAAAKALAGIAK